jgi:hypothetical protein
MIVCLLALVLLVTTASAAGPSTLESAAAIAELQLPKAALALAVHPVTGAVAAVCPNDDCIMLFPKLSAGSLDGAVTRQVPRGPMGVVCKQIGTKYIFAVVCREGNKMVLLDERLEVLKELPLSLDQPGSMFASLNPDDPFIYYCGGNGHDASVSCVNGSTMREEGKLMPPGHVSMSDGAISADGGIMYGRAPWSPTGFAASSILPPAAPVLRPS